MSVTTSDPALEIQAAGRGSGLRQGMIPRLAWRNLTRDRVRLTVTLVGIVFAVVLMGVQLGLLYGFATTASSLIAHADADLWVSAPQVQDVDQTVPIEKSNRYKVLGIAGVAAAENYLVHFADWRRPDGGATSVLVVGFDLETGIGGPWNLVAGRIEDLRQSDAVIIDELYRDKLGITTLGQSVEINGHRARVVGFTRGIRTFTQSPYVFTKFSNAQTYAGLDADQTSYVLVSLARRADRDAVAARLQAALPDLDVIKAHDFARRTQFFWLFTTGAGVAVLTGAGLGLIIGIVITGQTLYATTMDRLSEFATLRAIGAPASYLHRVILTQAIIAAGIGYGIGITVAEALVFLGHNGSAALLLPHWMALALGLVTVMMCSSAALLSVRKINGLQPTSVFR
ncbi:MAG TPA: ABC transporter permease [Alphaproteobacteria bacterium]|nr:ABC transporter permease [Alphaproteobacteria bacterium]